MSNQQSEQRAAAILPANIMLIEPAAEIEELKRHWEKIQQLKRDILDKSDIANIQGKTFVKRSGWRKMASAFAISDRIVSKEREDLGNSDFLWRIEVEAYHKASGRSMTGIAVCSSKERKFAHPEHDVYATCHTRAVNRAISDLVGLGEVSAEEIELLDHTPGQAQQQVHPTIQKEDICSCGHQKRLHGGNENTCMVGMKDGKQCQCTPY